jgi:predicted nucleic acid-binding protein
MRLYIDMSALKRPYDDQSLDRIWIEALAVMRILREATTSGWTILNSEALETENARNPKEVRRLRTAMVLDSFGPPLPVLPEVLEMAYELRRRGFDNMDALHLSFAKVHRVEYFVTCDDEIVTLSKRHELRPIAINPVDFIKECAG